MPVLALLALATACMAEDKPELEYPEVTLRGTQVRTLYSDIVNDNYKLFVSLPPGYRQGDVRCPVLYLSDGGSFFGYVRTMASSLMYAQKTPGLIVVGIGYVDGHKAWDNRRRDHLPAANPKLEGSGGAPLFARFLREELFPFVDSSYRTDPEDRIFAGMSSGGTLGAYILTTEPDTFDRYLIVSPALHSGNEMILDLEDKYFATHKDMRAIVYTAMGEHEPDSLMRAPWELLTDSLTARTYPGLTMTKETIEGGTHMDAVYCAYVRGLKAVYSDFEPER